MQGAIETKVSSGHSEFQSLAPVGYYLALRIGFAFPMEEANLLPPSWVQHYTQHGYLLQDPVIRWAYTNVGAVRWNALRDADRSGILDEAARFGLVHGVTVSCAGGPGHPQRSFGSFVRSDRDFTDAEIARLSALFEQLHQSRIPPSNLTSAELQALGLVRDGKLLKEIAFDLGVTEGAIKQRLKNAKKKLGARTSAQAVTMASDFGLL
ncbi:MAG: helix-turn-helix transcriptional regulator [Brevirhabdus sp.]